MLLFYHVRSPDKIGYPKRERMNKWSVNMLPKTSKKRLHNRKPWTQWRQSLNSFPSKGLTQPKGKKKGIFVFSNLQLQRLNQLWQSRRMRILHFSSGIINTQKWKTTLFPFLIQTDRKKNEIDTIPFLPHTKILQPINDISTNQAQKIAENPGIIVLKKMENLQQTQINHKIQRVIDGKVD